MQIIDVELDANSISIVFDRSLEYGFEIFIIPEGLTITFLACCLHRALIQEVDYSLYAVGGSCK